MDQLPFVKAMDQAKFHHENETWKRNIFVREVDEEGKGLKSIQAM